MLEAKCVSVVDVLAVVWCAETTSPFNDGSHPPKKNDICNRIHITQQGIELHYGVHLIPESIHYRTENDDGFN